MEKMIVMLKKNPCLFLYLDNISQSRYIHVQVCSLSIFIYIYLLPLDRVVMGWDRVWSVYLYFGTLVLGCLGYEYLEMEIQDMGGGLMDSDVPWVFHLGGGDWYRGDGGGDKARHLEIRLLACYFLWFMVLETQLLAYFCSWKENWWVELFLITWIVEWVHCLW